MPTIPPNYPHGCSDDEILQVMQEVAEDLARGGFDINHVLRISPIITVGQNEIQKRIAERSSVELQSWTPESLRLVEPAHRELAEEVGRLGH